MCHKYVLLVDINMKKLGKYTKKELIILAMVAAFMQQQVWNVASQMAEAQRETIKLQKLTVLVLLTTLFNVSL